MHLLSNSWHFSILALSNSWHFYCYLSDCEYYAEKEILQRFGQVEIREKTGVFAGKWSTANRENIHHRFLWTRKLWAELHLYESAQKPGTKGDF